MTCRLGFPLLLILIERLTSARAFLLRADDAPVHFGSAAAVQSRVLSPSIVVPTYQRRSARTIQLAVSTDDNGINQYQLDYQLSIHYCTGCRWGLRSFYMAQELLSTTDCRLQSVTLIPSRPPAPGGEFRILMRDSYNHNQSSTVWDRTVDGGFPQINVLVRCVQDRMQIDHTTTRDDDDNSNLVESTTPSINTQESKPVEYMYELPVPILQDTPLPNIAIAYCTECDWLLRACWIAQELLVTFDAEIKSISLVPIRPLSPLTKNGTFAIALNGTVLYCATNPNAVLELKTLKQLIRNSLAPTMDLGHSESNNKPFRVDDTKEPQQEQMDEDDAADARAFFGVM
jgi:selenoprotein W-related protein